MKDTILDYLKKNILPIISILLIIALFYVVFKGKRGNDVDYAAERKTLLDQIEVIRHERDSIAALQPEREKIIRQLEKSDSIIKVNIDVNNRALYEIEKQRIQLNNYSNLSSEQLRKYFSELR